MREVVVVGSGVAGLSSALAAAQEGAKVTVIERAARVGGSTALSGGVAWLPGNHLGNRTDDPDKANRYLGRLAIGDIDPALSSIFTADAPSVASWIEATTPLEWEVVHLPDYHFGFEGAMFDGRSLGPRPLELEADVSSMVRRAFRPPFTRQELLTGRIDDETAAVRSRQGTLLAGRALVGALLGACIHSGVDIQVGRRVSRLLKDQSTGRVLGVEVEGVDMPGAVILATGGFERNDSLSRAFLRGPVVAPVGVPTAQGDGLRMAMGVGAMLGNMSEAWWCPAIQIPGEVIDGAPLFRLLQAERTLPGSILVDCEGRRFVNEAQNYNDVGRTLFEFDPASFRMPRLYSWLLFDAAYRARYGMRWYVPAASEDPNWLIKASSWGELATKIGVDPATLRETVDRFNSYAADEHDPDFGRGDYPFDSQFGDRTAEHPTLGPLMDEPYYAVQVLPGCVGTKGGPKTSSDGRVLLAETGEAINGLFAAGNVAANPFGWAYPGAGGTIGPALVFGRRAGTAAALGEE